jgi:hypothetical protein
MDGNKYLSEALNQTLKLKTAKAAAGLPLKLWKVRAGDPMRTRSPAIQWYRTEQSICW